jgi:hypothetical protein
MKAIYGAIIGSLIFIVISIVIISIFSFIKIDSIRSDYNAKMKDIVDQINASQYYEYKFDKNNKSKLNVLHNDVNNKFITYDKALDSLNKKNILLNNSFINNGKQIRGHDWVTAGSNNSSWMNSSGEIRGNSWVGVGSNNSSWMNNAGEIRGNSWVGAGSNNASWMNSVGQIRGNSWVSAGSNNASWMNSSGKIYANNSIKSGGSIELDNQSAYMRNGELYAKTKLKVDGNGEIGTDLNVKGNEEIGKDLNVKGRINVNGTTTLNGQMTTPNGHVITCTGRQHIHGAEHLYLLNRTGVTVSKAWGGNGNITVEGQLCIGDVCITKEDLLKLKLTNSQQIVNSTIVSAKHQSTIATLLPSAKFSLLYRGSRDGYSAAAFHSKCDNQSPIFVIIKSTSGYIGTVYSSIPFTSAQQWKSATSGTCWLNNLENSSGTLSSTKSLNTDTRYSLFDYGPYGPTFGGGHDLHVADNCQTANSCYCNPHSYAGFNHSTMFGSNRWAVSEIEVYKVSF